MSIKEIVILIYSSFPPLQIRDLISMSDHKAYTLLIISELVTVKQHDFSMMQVKNANR